MVPWSTRLVFTVKKNLDSLFAPVSRLVTGVLTPQPVPLYLLVLKDFGFGDTLGHGPFLSDVTLTS